MIQNKLIVIINCLIKDISNTDHGGAIYIKKTTLSLIINDTTFLYFISTSGHGGAINFANGININLYRICSVV